MHPRQYYRTTPEKPVVIFEPSGKILTYHELEIRANQAARLFRSLGLKCGEKVAFCLENCEEVLEFCWAAQRSGLFFVPISSRLTGSEINYILKDSDTKLILTSDYIEPHLETIRINNSKVHMYKTGKKTVGFLNWRGACKMQSTEPIFDESPGQVMFYSSGTTGRPKGITPSLSLGETVEGEDRLIPLIQRIINASSESRYLCPAPLYHAAPLGWTMTINRLGGTAIIMERFEARSALSLIQKYKIDCAQFVPTHFIRMLKVPVNERESYDVSSLRACAHAAAPCPVPVKEDIIKWWGPIIHEYYAGSEGNGMTAITSEEWLDHKGSVGRAISGKVRICDEESNLLPPGQEGIIYFEGGRKFSYHNDEGKTAAAYNKQGWTTIGDIGKLDKDGYLFLTDRKSFMIITGGVNVYPQEIENIIILHPKVLDVAVIGGPDPDLGEKVIAIIELQNASDADEHLKMELEAYCKNYLSGPKIPRQFDFIDQLPRAQTGKLYKRNLRDLYWQNGNNILETAGKTVTISSPGDRLPYS